MLESEVFHSPQDPYGSVLACAFGGFARLQANLRQERLTLSPTIRRTRTALTKCTLRSDMLLRPPFFYYPKASAMILAELRYCQASVCNQLTRFSCLIFLQWFHLPFSSNHIQMGPACVGCKPEALHQQQLPRAVKMWITGSVCASHVPCSLRQLVRLSVQGGGESMPVPGEGAGLLRERCLQDTACGRMLEEREAWLERVWIGPESRFWSGNTRHREGTEQCLAGAVTHLWAGGGYMQTLFNFYSLWPSHFESFLLKLLIIVLLQKPGLVV